MLPTLRKHVYYPFNRGVCFAKNELPLFFSNGVDYSIPAVNIKENADRFDIEIAVPGLRKDDFKIVLDKNILTVSSDTNKNENDEKESFMRKEFSFNSFSRSFSIPEKVDFEKIKALHENGILKLQLPFRDEAKQNPKREITVN